MSEKWSRKWRWSREEESTIRESTEEFSIENIEAPQDSEPVQSSKNELMFFTENFPTSEQNGVIEEIAQDPYFYPPKISKGSVVAVAWGKIYTIAKVFVDIR